MGLQTKAIKYSKHWKEIPLEEVCLKITDGTHHTPEYVQNGVPFISVKDIKNNRIDFSNCKYISNKQHEELSKRCCPEKDNLLVTKSGTIGRMAVVPNKPAFSLFVSVALIKNINDFIFTKFLQFCLENYFNSISIEQDIKGGLLKNFHLEDIRGTPVPVVSLSEQHRIVAKIEELFSSLDKGIESLKTAQAQLKTYRQAVLKWAFEGKLTNKNVKEGELPEGWCLKKISELSKVVRGGSPRPAGDPRYYDGDIPFLKVADLTKDNHKYLTHYSYTIKEAGLHKTRKIEPETLLLTNSGATLGVPKICRIFATMNDGIAAFLDLDKRSLLYLYYFWISKTKELRTINQGAAQPNLNTEIIKSYDIPYCSFSEQQRVVLEIESRLSVCDKLEETITQSLAQAEALRQSILKKAFAGKLVPQDPNDEPAGVLLERIRTERQNSQPVKKTRKTKKKAHAQRNE